MPAEAIRTVGFLGVGLMGAPMARHLLSAGFRLRVWNRTRSKVAPLVEAGATAAPLPAEAADGADVLCLCVTDKRAVESILFGPGGAVGALRMPPLVVDFSTIGPTATLALAERLEHQRGTSWVDAPVSGGATGAEHRKLVIMCGGPPADVARLGPLFAAFSQRVTRVGELGAGQTLKLCNQLIVATNLVAISEAFKLASDSGLDLQAIPQALAGGFADSIPLQIFGPRMAQGTFTPVLGELALMLKDLSAVEDLAGEHGSALPMTQAALEIYREAAKRGLIHEDLAALFKLYANGGA
ncbi:MAG TPA: NAD(P)-dependent oxidoreductase [Steroidobacteraceae bacterium]|nr:NAD(P)-dependent oxidoreductase [Steroidobacteraceae bacterium]